MIGNKRSSSTYQAESSPKDVKPYEVYAKLYGKRKLQDMSTGNALVYN